MIFELGMMTGAFQRQGHADLLRRPERPVLGRHGAGKGIKPGSEEFHALKRGDFEYRRDTRTRETARGREKAPTTHMTTSPRDKGKGKGSDDSYEDQIPR
jgi:hypothetical protein